jgi:hypothetical protein
MMIIIKGAMYMLAVLHECVKACVQPSVQCSRSWNVCSHALSLPEGRNDYHLHRLWSVARRGESSPLVLSKSKAKQIKYQNVIFKKMCNKPYQSNTVILMLTDRLCIPVCGYSCVHSDLEFVFSDVGFQPVKIIAAGLPQSWYSTSS